MHICCKLCADSRLGSNAHRQDFGWWSVVGSIRAEAGRHEAAAPPNPHLPLFVYCHLQPRHRLMCRWVGGWAQSHQSITSYKSSCPNLLHDSINHMKFLCLLKAWLRAYIEGHSELRRGALRQAVASAGSAHQGFGFKV